jgi:hypothetical protein
LGYTLQANGPVLTNGLLKAQVINGTGGDANNLNNLASRTFVINP